MLLIGEFARAGNGYRWYSPAQFAQLNQIQAFKDMGLALQEIRELLQRRLVPQELRAVLEERREVLRKRVRDDVGRLERIEARLNSISAGGPHSHLTIMLRTAPGQSVASFREKLQNCDQVDELFTTLERRVPPRVLYDQRGAIFQRCLEGDGEIDCEVLRFLKHPEVRPGDRTPDRHAQSTVPLPSWLSAVDVTSLHCPHIVPASPPTSS